jgi:hypothetical protein
MQKKIFVLFIMSIILCSNNGFSQSLNGHEYVDLGLPSGTKWAKCNIGAKTPESYGDLFAWGETKTKANYGGQGYCFNGEVSSTLKKYSSETTVKHGEKPDNLLVLEAVDDAATANWGEGWRMPTDADFGELLSNCTATWTTQNEIKGYIFTGPNGNSIFLPAAGWCSTDNVIDRGSSGCYWSKSLNRENVFRAYNLEFSSNNCKLNDSGRSDGISVRPVCN